ncbi:hypothetical protein [Sphingomonas sp. LHG3406-1]|uniref:hypothetical protein n=1 Tax=Sphingomonas sp. LHG3406-1 TaxID=2804617 RepID=UPI002606BB5E|nr:hypothetical protein [Sphingomonas sp. LHG3406-1]
MSIRFAAALALAAVMVPAAARAVPAKEVSAGAKAEAATPMPDPAEAFAFMTKVFDRFFPAGPEPDPARLVAAREMTYAMFPKGAYGAAMSGFAERMADQVLSMSEADLAALMPPTPAPKDARGSSKTKAEATKVKAPPSTEPLRASLARKDPQFDAKVAAGKAFARTMIVKFGDVMEPKFREGMARSMARKFDAAQMAEIRGFLATPTGAAYGRQMLGMWFEPDVMRGTFEAMPELLKLMPDIMKDAGAFDAEMKGLDARKRPAKAD